MEVNDIQIDKLEESSINPRAELQNLEELKASIDRLGLLEPLRIWKHNSKREVIIGNRRFRACEELGSEDCTLYNLYRI